MHCTLYSTLLKIEENTDGTLTVEGIASAETVDAAGETILAAAMEAALPDFFAYGTGNLREMHQPLAAGTVDVAEVNDAGETRISATVVDPVAISKIKTGTYKGLSVGGKVLARDPKNRKIITKIKLYEISLVDRPCNPDAKIEVWKAYGLTPPDLNPSQDEMRAAFDALPEDDRALALIKATFFFPRSIGDLQSRGRVGR